MLISEVKQKENQSQKNQVLNILMPATQVKKKVVILTKKKRKKQVVAKENLQSLKSNIFSFLFFKINYLGNQKSKKQTKRIKI